MTIHSHGRPWMRRLAAPFIFTLLAGCASQQPSHFGSLASLHKEMREHRWKECLSSWNSYEGHCRIELQLYKGAGMVQFCRAYANSQVSSFVLPGEQQCSYYPR